MSSVSHSVGSGEMPDHKEVSVYSPEYLLSVTPVVFLKPDTCLSLSFLLLRQLLAVQPRL